MPIIVKMEPLSVFQVLRQVITSWQVIVITIAIVLFLYLFFFLARSHHRPMSIKKISFKKKKPKPAETTEITEDDGGRSSANEELGLEEE